MSKVSWTPEEDEAFKAAAAEGVSAQRLAVRFKRTPAAIRNRAKDLEITITLPVRLSTAERAPLSKPRKR